MNPMGYNKDKCYCFFGPDYKVQEEFFNNEYFKIKTNPCIRV